MDNNYQKNNHNLTTLITQKTKLTGIDYVNEYDDYYIVKDKTYLYIFDNKYEEILRIDNILIHDNKKNYAIIYKDNKVMYLNDYLKKNKLYYEYYDLYTYELIDKIVIGGQNGK